MWAYVKDGVVEQVNAHQTRLQPNPGQYFQTKYADEWTKEQKEAYGVYEVEEDTKNQVTVSVEDNVYTCSIMAGDDCQIRQEAGDDDNSWEPGEYLFLSGWLQAP